MHLHILMYYYFSTYIIIVYMYDISLMDVILFAHSCKYHTSMQEKANLLLHTFKQAHPNIIRIRPLIYVKACNAVPSL